MKELLIERGRNSMKSEQMIVNKEGQIVQPWTPIQENENFDGDIEVTVIYKIPENHRIVDNLKRVHGNVWQEQLLNLLKNEAESRYFDTAVVEVQIIVNG